MLKIELKENPINFYDLEVGTLFIWHDTDSWGDLVGMKISDADGKEPKVLDFEDVGIYYKWDDKYVIDRIIKNMTLSEL